MNRFSLALTASAVALAALASACDRPAAAGPAVPAPPASASAPRAAPADPQFEMYQLVLLRRGPAWTPEKTPAIAELQRAHLAHLGAMGDSGKMVIAGPFDAQEDVTLRGMCLYRVATPAEARALAEADPMVKAGRLRVEVMTWYVEKGYMEFPKAPRPTPSP
jgi:uncharacterized protein